MKHDLLRPFEAFPYFTMEGFKQSTRMENPEQVRMLLYRWAKAEHIIPIKKGMYMSRRFYDLHHGEDGFSAAVSAMLQPQSYLSCEFILQRKGILTDVTYPVTAITIKNTRQIVNRMGTFWYRHIRLDLYRGFDISEYHGVRVARARLAKALFDLLYLRPIPAVFRLASFNLAEEFRMNITEFSTAERDEFGHYVKESGKHKMQQILENFRRTVWRP